MYDVVVSYYSRECYPASVRASAQFSLSCYRADPLVSSIYLVDGSESRDHVFEHWCKSNRVNYIHVGMSLTFAEAYNCGISLCSSQWVALSACDVYIPRQFFSDLNSLLSAELANAIGCIVPSLSSSDIPSQERLSRRPRPVGLMSLNLNVFPASVLHSIGGVPVSYSGAYNDIEISLMLRQQSLSILQVPLRVLHYGRLTISQGSDYRFNADREHFFAEHPDLFSPVSLCGLKLDRFHSGWRQWLFWLERVLPFGRFHVPIQRWLWYQFG